MVIVLFWNNEVFGDEEPGAEQEGFPADLGDRGFIVDVLCDLVD